MTCKERNVLWVKDTQRHTQLLTARGRNAATEWVSEIKKKELSVKRMPNRQHICMGVTFSWGVFRAHASGSLSDKLPI